MNKIFLFFKELFIRKNKVKLLDPPIKSIEKQDNSDFMASLKVNVSKKEKQIETLTCVGDGLGIQNIIHY